MKKSGQYLTCFQRKLLSRSLQADIRPEYRRRIQIMLLADEGQSQARICEALGCSQEMARHWMIMAQTGQAHLWSDRPMGRPKTVNQEYLNRLQELVRNSPRQYGYAFDRWTGHWLSKQLAKDLGIEITAGHVNRLLKQMGLSARSQSVIKEGDSSTKIDDPKLAIQELILTTASELLELWHDNSFG